MRRLALFALFASLVVAPFAVAQDESARTTEPLVLSLPETTGGCLSMLEDVIERAAAADMLDDQVEKAEAELERMEAHCFEKRFAEALGSAQLVMALVAANK